LVSRFFYGYHAGSSSPNQLAATVGPIEINVTLVANYPDKTIAQFNAKIISQPDNGHTCQGKNKQGGQMKAVIQGFS